MRLLDKQICFSTILRYCKVILLAGLASTTTAKSATTDRSFTFFVTADPQYDNANHARNGRATQVMQHLEKALLDGLIEKKQSLDIETFKRQLQTVATRKASIQTLTKQFGLLVAGDLTQNTRLDELNMYRKATKGIELFLFDGQGNHDDMDPPTHLHISACWPLIRLPYCTDEKEIINEIMQRQRLTSINKSDQGTVYSWDWQGIHFVQLGTYPGIARNENNFFADVDPHHSLAFLRKDLKSKVGNSKRPVMLVMHYEFYWDIGSGWSRDEEKAFWDTIADYNVVAIFCGHIHLAAGHAYSWSRLWERPLGSTKGPNTIPFFISGATFNGIYLQVDIASNNQQASIKRFYLNPDGLAHLTSEQSISW